MAAMAVGAAGATFDLNGVATLVASRAYDITLAGTGSADAPAAPALTNSGTTIGFTGSWARGVCASAAEA